MKQMPYIREDSTANYLRANYVFLIFYSGTVNYCHRCGATVQP